MTFYLISPPNKKKQNKTPKNQTWIAAEILKCKVKLFCKILEDHSEKMLILFTIAYYWG